MHIDSQFSNRLRKPSLQPRIWWPFTTHALSGQESIVGAQLFRPAHSRYICTKELISMTQSFATTPTANSRLTLLYWKIIVQLLKGVVNCGQHHKASCTIDRVPPLASCSQAHATITSVATLSHFAGLASSILLTQRRRRRAKRSGFAAV